MENCTIEFWEHQKIMFLKCKMIEEKYNLGILADNPGSGKTLVSLALISSTIKESRNEKKPNIIVVAENIYYQWIDNIEKFKNLSYKKFVDYQDISYLYFNMSDLLNYDILLTTPLYYNIIVQNINNIGKDCYRLIIDEIDSVSNILREKINCKKTWYISGTFSFDKIKNLNIDYHFGINEENQSNIICKLDEENYFPINNLLEPTYEIIKCKNIYLDNILCQFKDDIFTSEEIDKLNGLDIEGFTALAGLNQNIMDLRMITHQFITNQKKLEIKILKI